MLACPLDGSPLELVVWEMSGDEVITGLLLNPRRKIAYPIHAGLPRLLTFRTGVAESFARKHGRRLGDEHRGYVLPDAEGAPGERDVLRTFSAEWLGYEWNPRAYWNLDAETWFKCMRFILRLERHPIVGKRVLEVGIGIGGVADYNARVEGAEVVGMDLGYAVDAAYKQFGANPRLHIVQGSAFAPPFPPGAFDFVYSFGVIHHTSSTQAAFGRLALLPRQGGHLNVWVYSPYDEQRNLLRRILMAVETAVRPVVWRLPDAAQTAALLPFVPLYLGFQRLRAMGGKGQVPYGWREALHAARDRFTPRFAHRHTDEEVAQWFMRAGYGDLEHASRLLRPDWVPIGFTACTGVDAVRKIAVETRSP